MINQEILDKIYTFESQYFAEKHLRIMLQYRKINEDEYSLLLEEFKHPGFIEIFKENIIQINKDYTKIAISRDNIYIVPCYDNEEKAEEDEPNGIMIFYCKNPDIINKHFYPDQETEVKLICA